MTNVGKNIRTIRREAKLTQEQLAQRLYVTAQTVSNYETGATRPDIDMLVKLSEVLSCPVTELIYGRALTPEKKREYILCAVALGCSAVFFALHLLLMPLCDSIAKTYFLNEPRVLVRLVISPLLFISFGFFLMTAVGLIFGAKPLKPPYAGYVRIAIFASLFVLFVFTLPLLSHSISVCYNILVSGIKSAYNMDYSMDITSLWTQLSLRVTLFFMSRAYLFLLPGAALWASHKKNKKDSPAK